MPIYFFSSCSRISSVSFCAGFFSQEVIFAGYADRVASELRELGPAHIGNSCLLLTVIIG